ncbi:MAG TPA: hypothetical protein VIK59_10910 [Verrucomicrobiae bacterium]
MKSAMLVEDFDETFELTPAKGCANAFVIHPKDRPRHDEEKMTAVDWNKFEKDIADAFEQIP